MRPGMAVAMGILLTVLPATISLAISGAGVEPKTLDRASWKSVTIRYELSEPAMVTVEILDENGESVRRLDAGRQSAGKQAVVWDGQSSEGQPAPGGVYRYVIHAQAPSGQGQPILYDPSEELGGEELEPRDFQFDSKGGWMLWVMPKAGYARLRIGIEGFPHLRTVLDWEPMEGGAQRIHWDGLDSSGLVNLREHPHLSVKLAAFSMPPNTIIVRGAPPSAPPVGPQPPPSAARERAMYLHARHPRSLCHEVGAAIEFPEGLPHDPKGRPVLAGIVPIRIRLDERDAARILDERFEVALFEDLTVIFEEEEGLNPLTYLWDTTKLTPGPHLLTVNILGYEDHFGVKTEQVIIAGEAP